MAPLAEDVRDEFLKQAAAYHSAGRFDLAAPLYEHVEKHNPDALAASYFRALMDVETGRLENALTRLQRVAKADPNSPEPNYSLGYVYQELGHWKQAEAQFRRVLEINPTYAGVRFMWSKTFEVLGRMDEAYEQLRYLATDKATRWRALAQIAQITPQKLTDEEVVELRNLADDQNQPMAVRISAEFASGEVLENRKRYDEAFAAFANGNSLRHQHLVDLADETPKLVIAPPKSRPRLWHPEKAAQEHRNQVDFAKKTFTKDFLEAHAGQGDVSHAPIFIVGMPRSGSTLIEQILSSHALVTGLGECAAFWDTVRGAYPYVAAQSETFAPKALARTYLRKMHDLGWGKTPFVVDKMLGNYLTIGMIHVLYPNATILHCVRDPVDNCLACYRKLFKSGNETTFDLAEVGEQYVRYREMMAHWDDVLPGRVIDVVHEDMVADPDQKIRWLVTQACKLKWDENCLRFYETARPVRTASIAQVRKPIFTTSVERWRRYEKHLGPLFEALGPYAPPAREKAK